MRCPDTSESALPRHRRSAAESVPLPVPNWERGWSNYGSLIQEAGSDPSEEGQPGHAQGLAGKLYVRN